MEIQKILPSCFLNQACHQVMQAKIYADALSCWDDEGGAGAGIHGSHREEEPRLPRYSTDMKMMQLHTRVIALENLVVTLLAWGSNNQRQQVRDMATFIAPRSGATPHPLTIGAAMRMCHMAERGDYFSAAAKIHDQNYVRSLGESGY